MKLWIVSMECAGIAEAGGVKNVSFSLCKEFTRLNHKVTLFIPVFKCNTWENVLEYKEIFTDVPIEICGKTEKVSYASAISSEGNFSIIFINSRSFAEKENIYTYSENEEKMNPIHKKGTGYEDAIFMDVLFQKAVYEYGRKIPRSEIPDIVHCQDASTATLPGFMHKGKTFSKSKAVVTIHNCGPGYHHNFSSIGEAVWYTGLDTQLLTDSTNGTTVEPFLIAANSGAYLTTVSEDYALEITDPLNIQFTDGLSAIFAEKNIKIKGITNGFDLERYNPEFKGVSLLPFEFSPEKNELDGKLKCRKFFIQNIVNTDNYDCTGIKKFGHLECSPSFTKEIYFSYHGRITNQKGIIILLDAIPSIIQNFPNTRFILVGQGDPGLENEILKLTKQFAGKVVFLNGYHRVITRLATASADFTILPSFFEPCGLEDFIAQVYGTIPIAHKTGGLNKIQDYKTGFLYENNTFGCLISKITEAIMIKLLKPSQFSKMIKTAACEVRKEYLWKNVIQKKYIPFFKEILKEKNN